MLQVSNKLGHLYAFRLTDEDDEKLRWILEKFHLGSRKKKSGTFRYLVRELYDVLREMDFQSRMPVQAAAQVPEDLSSTGPRGSDVDDEDLDPYVEEPWENPKEDPDYSRLRCQAIQQLRMNGGCVDLKAVWAAVEKLKKKEDVTLQRLSVPGPAEP